MWKVFTQEDDALRTLLKRCGSVAAAANLHKIVLALVAVRSTPKKQTMISHNKPYHRVFWDPL